MPYPPEHKPQTRAKIVQCARQLFNQRGFTEVSIDDVMAAAGLTRGGFYNHFKTKDALLVEVLAAYARERQEEAPDDVADCGPEIARQMLNQYVSRQHLDDVKGHCPLIALPADVARSDETVRAAYQNVLEALVYMFEGCLEADNAMSARERALAIAATSVGAMVLARTIDDAALADEICAATRKLASDVIAPSTEAEIQANMTMAGK